MKQKLTFGRLLLYVLLITAAILFIAPFGILL